ncbi:MAG: hypothetical protein ABH878_01240 [bacterium]
MEKTKPISKYEESFINRLLSKLDDEELFVKQLETLEPRELAELQIVLWNHVIDYSHNGGRKLSRADITGRMEPTSNFQYRMGCAERVDYCRANVCMYTHPNCAGTKFKSQITVLRKILMELTAKQ